MVKAGEVRVASYKVAARAYQIVLGVSGSVLDSRLLERLKWNESNK